MLCFELHRVMRSIGLHRKSLPPARDARISIVHRGDRVLTCTCNISCIIWYGRGYDSYPLPINTLFNSSVSTFLWLLVFMWWWKNLLNRITHWHCTTGLFRFWDSQRFMLLWVHYQILISCCLKHWISNTRTINSLFLFWQPQKKILIIQYEKLWKYQTTHTFWNVQC